MPVRKVRRRMGMGLFGSIGSFLGSKAGDALGGIVGLGRKRRVRRGGMTLDQARANSRPIKLAVVTPEGIAAWNVGRVGMARRRRVRRGGAVIPAALKPAATILKNYLLNKGKDYVGNKIESMYGFGRRRRPAMRRRGGRVYNRLLL